MLYKHGNWKDLDYFNYLGVFIRHKDNYFNALRRLKKASNTHNTYELKDAFQNNYSFGLDVGLSMLEKEVKEKQKKIFDWLDGVKNPYYYIYYQAYEYNTYNNKYGLFEINGTGINELNHELAKDYANTKLN